jgi:hypothetical protein
MLGGSVAALNVPIAKCIQWIRPNNVLEYGCGWGKFGRICQQIEVAPERLVAVQKLFNPGDKEGIMSHGYTEIIDEDIKSYVNNGIDTRYDMIVALDVIEHFFFGDAISIVDYSLYNCSYFLLVWPSRLPQNIGDDFTFNKFDLHRTSFELSEISTRFDVVYYSQASLSEHAGQGRYHLALLRGHMNFKPLLPPIA